MVPPVHGDHEETDYEGFIGTRILRSIPRQRNVVDDDNFSGVYEEWGHVFSATVRILPLSISQDAPKVL